MKFTDVRMETYDDEALRTAFRQYFDELGCRITNWAGLFAGMNEVGREYTWKQDDGQGGIASFVSGLIPEERDFTWTRRDETGRVIGFIQYTATEMTGWFFRAKTGFVREFWVAPEYRGQGHGTALLAMAEAELAEAGCGWVLLTTVTAADFYRRFGYEAQPMIRARNQEPVFARQLRKE